MRDYDGPDFYVIIDRQSRRRANWATTPFPGSLLKETLNNSILEFSEYGKRKTWFLLTFIFTDMLSLKMAAHPCAAGTAALIQRFIKILPQGVKV